MPEATTEWNRDRTEYTLDEILNTNELIEEVLDRFPVMYLIHEYGWEELLAYLGISYTGKQPFHVLFKGIEFFKIGKLFIPDHSISEVWRVELPGINLEQVPRPCFFIDQREINETDIFVE